MGSSRIVGDPHSSIVDVPLTATQGDVLSVAAWYARRTNDGSKCRRHNQRVYEGPCPGARRLRTCSCASARIIDALTVASASSDIFS
jgi:hypothetical protein